MDKILEKEIEDILDKPSMVTNDYWVHATRKEGKYPKPKNSGKWLLFVPNKSIDEVWAKIKRATEEGLLGERSKCATAIPNPNAKNQDSKVICVYTYDWTDKEDVMKIREQLRQLGITNKIPYKSDEDTLTGKYLITGHTKISKYYE